MFSDSEFSELAKELGEITLPDDPDDWVMDIQCSDTGYVRQITVGGRTVTGNRFREVFSLRSAVFTLSHGESGFKITTRGYGHLVGMSQYGADAMARSGADHQQILRHFYTDITISGE